MVEIVRKSMVSGKIHSMDLDITRKQYSAWLRGTPIQEAMPHLSANEREFLMTGITPEEWAETFSEEEEIGRDF